MITIVYLTKKFYAGFSAQWCSWGFCTSKAHRVRSEIGPPFPEFPPKIFKLVDLKQISVVFKRKKRKKKRKKKSFSVSWFTRPNNAAP